MSETGKDIVRLDTKTNEIVPTNREQLTRDLAELDKKVANDGKSWKALDAYIAQMKDMRNKWDLVDRINNNFAKNKKEFARVIGLTMLEDSQAEKLASDRNIQAQVAKSSNNSFVEKIPSSDARTAFNSAMANLKETSSLLNLTVGQVNGKIAIVNSKGEPMRAPMGVQGLVAKANEASEKMRNTAVAMK